MRLAAGDLDQRVTLQNVVTSRSATGAEVQTWQDVATVYAAVRPIRGREFFAAGETQSAVDVRVLIRYRDDVTREMRVVHRGKPLDIVSVIDQDSRRESLELMCVSGVRNGR